MRVLLAILLLIAGERAYSKVLEVGATKPYKTIKSALSASVDGDIIVINRGTYSEGEIVIGKSITLHGLKGVVIDGKNRSQVLRLEANDVTIEGLQINNGGYSSSYDWAAIKAINSAGIIIRNNRLNNNTFGIYLQQCSGSLIENNIVVGGRRDEVESGNAIHCWKSDSITIRNNEVTGHRDGIYFEFVTNSHILNNNSHDNIRYGLHFMFSHSDTYINNTFRANGAGVAVMFSKHVTMLYNHFAENWGSAAYGILMKEISDGLVEHNTFLKNTMGIYMEGTNRIIVRKNLFRENGWAMRMQSSCEDNEVTANNFIRNTFDVATNGEVQLNKFYSNYWDKYEGYDLNKDNYGDVPFRPVSLYSMVVERIPSASLLLRSFMVSIMDKVERLIPSLTPIEMKDDKPLMKPLSL